MQKTCVRILIEVPGSSMSINSKMDRSWHVHMMKCYNCAKQCNNLTGRILNERSKIKKHKLFIIPFILSSRIGKMYLWE
jgi:hypothetical protein